MFRTIPNWRRWAVVIGAGVLPALLLRCDRMALNLQRGFFWGLGQEAAQIVTDMVATAQDGQ